MVTVPSANPRSSNVPSSPASAFENDRPAVACKIAFGTGCPVPRAITVVIVGDEEE